MDIQKEKEIFDAYWEKEGCNADYEHKEYAWSAWQAAKAEAMPENKQFNLDEFLAMEEKLKHKGGVITADLDRFIAYAEMVLEKAKALKEPK